MRLCDPAARLAAHPYFLTAQAHPAAQPHLCSWPGCTCPAPYHRPSRPSAVCACQPKGCKALSLCSAAAAARYRALSGLAKAAARHSAALVSRPEPLPRHLLQQAVCGREAVSSHALALLSWQGPGAQACRVAGCRLPGLREASPRVPRGIPQPRGGAFQQVPHQVVPGAGGSCQQLVCLAAVGLWHTLLRQASRRGCSNHLPLRAESLDLQPGLSRLWPSGHPASAQSCPLEKATCQTKPSISNLHGDSALDPAASHCHLRTKNPGNDPHAQSA